MLAREKTTGPKMPESVGETRSCREKYGLFGNPKEF
jgi:hypothetical protein